MKENFNDKSLTYDMTISEFYSNILRQKLNNDLKIFHMNIRSINANFYEFKHIMHEIYHEIDIIIFSECWIQNIELFANELENFELLYSNKLNRAGGIVMFHNTRKVKVVNCIYDPLEACDSLLVRVEIENHTHSDLIGVYRSPSENPLHFTEGLEKYLHGRDKSTTLMGLIGDFNLCMNNGSADDHSEQLYDIMLKYGFLPTRTIYTPTRVTLNSCSLIDQIFVHKQFSHRNDIKSGNLLTCITDHYLQYFVMSTPERPRNSIATRPLIRIFSQKNKDKFVKCLSEIHFVYSHDLWSNIDFLFRDFLSRVEQCYCNCFPLIQLSRRKAKNKPWFDKQCENALKNKVNHYKIYLQKKNESSKLKYEHLNRVYKKLIRQAKNNYNRKMLEGCNKSKDLWKIINSFLGKNKARKEIKLKHDGNVIDDNEMAADIMNSYFNQVGHTYGQSPPFSGAHKQFMEPYRTEAMICTEISFAETKKC